MWLRRKASGLVRATSSMSIPPSDDTIAMYCLAPRSSVMAA